MTDSTAKLILDNFGIRIQLSEIPEFQYRRDLRNKLYGTWWRRLWWTHIAQVIAPRWRKQRMHDLEIAERQARQALVNEVLREGAMQ